MDMDVCVHSPGSIHCCDYVTDEGSSPCGVVTAAMFAHNCCVYCGELTLQDSEILLWKLGRTVPEINTQ